nr:hypothetical protein [Methylomarinum sp. Ch1-1]MDP4519862.1 hypothetical protein [Methylomarinum sp. Ch1-1]
MIFWVNFHGSFIVGIAFSVFFAVEAIFNASIEKRKVLILQWSCFTFICIICAMISPHGINGLLLPFQLADQGVALSRIVEWLSPNFHKFQPLEVWLLTFLAIALWRGIKLPLFRLVFMLGLIHLSLKHVRHASDLLSVLSPLILATPLAKQLEVQSDLNFRELGFRGWKAWLFIGGVLREYSFI